MLAGGPPCQGFSAAGRRDPHDPRNALVSDYLRLVKSLRPNMVLIENVRGITIDFIDRRSKLQRINYSEQIRETLSKDYWVFSRVIDTSRFGVPQERRRFFIIGLRRMMWPTAPDNPFDILESLRPSFLRAKGLTSHTPSRSALSDLEISKNGLLPSVDSEGFDQIGYIKPDTRYQKLMHAGFNSAPSDLRLARHRPDIQKRFAKIIEICRTQGRLNISIDTHLRDQFSLKKQALRVLDPDRPAPTITSMPDDLLHYIEPRTLTVRENARLQSFPDWFAFRGKYTTGGDRRRREVPRFTQVANAVPPLLAEALGHALKGLARTQIADAVSNNQTLTPVRTASA
jgi:DNA (cytosine-5)-methyltransferase 1